MGEEGQTLQVGEIICKIETEGANPAEQKQEQSEASAAAETPAAESRAEEASQPNKSATRQLYFVWPESTELILIK